MATKRTRAPIRKTTVAKAKKSASKAEQKSVVAPLDELGSTGLQRSAGGTIEEEFLRDLSGERGLKVYREMKDNDGTVGALLYAIEMLLRNVEWTLEGEDQERIDFVESCVDDMTSTWQDTIAEILSMLAFGFSWHEIIYKRRNGNAKDSSQRSKFKDGRIGWRKLPIRAQNSLLRWDFDDEGGVQAFCQLAPPNYREVSIPIERSLLFRIGVHKGNPQGRSILRNAYRPWFFKRRIEELEGIGIERDLAGLPVILRTGEAAKKYDVQLKNILRNVRRGEQEGVLLPLIYDENGNPEIEFKLMTSGGTRQIDPSKTITRYDQAIATTCLADFLLLGQDQVGSFALADSKTSLFSLSLGAILQSIAAVFNRHAIPRLMAINGWPEDESPILVPGDIESPNLEVIGQFLTSMSGAGAPLFPDDGLEAYLRRIANLPPKEEGNE